MASLRDVVSEYQDDLRNGIAWLAFWREGRSWQAEAFHLDLDDTLYPEDRARLAEIQAADPRAIAVNGYYSGYLSEKMSVAELAAGVRHHYDNGLNNIAPFIEAHSDELPPDVLEAAREKAHAAGLPFYERPYRGDDIDPYTYDGHMSIEDYELMQKLMEQDRERSEPMSEVFSILLHNRQRYEQGKEGLWFSLPTTTEKLQAALREIGISADNPQDFFLYGYRSPQERPIKLPRDLVLSADVDELNFLAARLEKLDAAELAELNAALTSPQSDFHSIGQIIDYPDNVDYYVHLPDVTGTGQLGDYYLNRSGMVDMPEEWKAGIFLPSFGLHIANTEHGVFTDYGYLVKSGDEWQRVHEGQPVPEEYRVMAYPAPEILRDEAPARTVQPEAAPAAEAAAPPPVVPIILNSQNSADRMKEITDRLETGIQELFESERYKAYLTSMAKFHSYSFNNTLLIAMQGGQLVAGYNKWRDDFHRNVKRGEKGIKILAPAPYKVKKEVPKLDEQGQPVMDKDGNPVTEKKEIQVPAFKIVSVFDVSQTEGEPLPSIGVDELAGNVEQYEDFFKALEQTSPVPMAFEDIPGGSHGYYHLTEKRIAIQENMSELQTLKTAIHEIAHAKLHAIDPDAPVTEQADRPDSRTREVQAESVAYAVCQHYGLDTSDYSFGYVAGWSSGKDLKELRASLETIRATAHELITAIDGHLAELQQQRQAQQTVEQAAEQPAPDSVFSKLPPEQQQEMTDSVKAMLQTLIDADVKSTGEVTQGTLDAIQTQGFVLSGDGTLQRAEASQTPEPQAEAPALDPAAEPVVTILFSESPHLEMGQQMPLHEADALFARLDAEHRGGGYYDKTDFRIDFTFQGEPHSYSGRQDFGDRDGSLIEHIREYQTFYLNDEKWKDHLTRQGGPEAWAEDHASREAFLTEIIPYMELHCNLSRLEQEVQTRLASSDTLTPEETAYYGALVDYAMECRPLLNHGEPLPEMPKLTDFDQSLQDYKAQVEAEIAQEAADAGMTVEEYAAVGYEAPAQPQEAQEPPQQETPEQPTKEPAASDYYYSINEGAARRAKEMNSFSDYQPGSATAEYRHYVDKAFALAQEQKKRVDPMYHEKIDSLLDTYARKLAANMNHGYEIDARVPSILIAGGSNFPVRKKEKQNAARDSNMQEWQYIQGLLDKIRSTGMGGIRQDDPQAIPKLQKKLDGLEKAQETMKAVNAYYRKHGTLDGCPHLSPENIENLKADMASGWHYEKKPFQSWELSNNNAEIRRVRQRIESLTRANEVAYVGWEFDGGHVEANRDQGRLQVFFDGKPEADARQQLKENGFRWAPSVGAWQRLLNDNAYRASDRIACIQPLSGIKPTELQRNSSREQREQMAQDQTEPDYFYRVHATPSSDSRENLYMLQAYVPQDNGRAKIGDILYVGTPERCRELMDQLNTGELTQEAIKELYAKEQEQPTPEPTPEQEPAPEPEPEQEPMQEPETAPAQEVTSDDEPQAAPAKTLTELQEKALEIADRYKDLPLQAKIDVIAQAFGCKTGEIHTSPCTGKWRGTSDMTIRFDNGASLFIGNHLTPKAKTVKVQTECVNRTLVQYNPEIVKATKEAALPALLQREAKDNEIAAQKGLKPYTLLNVEFNEGADEKTGGYIGWYYVTLAVDGKICTHLETGLNHDIADGKVSDTPTRADYYPAGALKEADVDYVFNNVGFSSASTLYTVPLRDDVRERAEKTLAERSAAAPEAGREWGFYIIPDLKTWATNAEQQTPIEHFATFEEAKARFDELRSQPYNSEAKDLNTDGRPYAHLTLGMESKDGMSAADILHVRAGQNYLVEDFTRMERLRSDPVVLESLSRVAQEIGFDRVRPYVMENSSYKAMPDMPFTQWENPYFTVDPPAQEQGNTFAIYQLKGGPETRDYRFEAYESLQEAGLAVDRQNYDLVYTAPLDGKTTLEDIYRTFNLDRPADFTGHSLSVSDVVVLNHSGKEEAHYCDSFGFTPVPEFFLQREKQLTPRELLTGESIQTPRGSFLVTDMSREQLEAAGYGFHHQSEDGKYLIMGNGTDAFAIPAQQESPIKAAEMTTEQNYNMIDGVLNNAPTMSELEAKAKAGEQISLFDVAEAAKAEARKPKQPQRPAQKPKKPSIRAQLKAAKEEQQKKPPQREKTQELEV
ncbi:YodL domain-containing protein [Flavonifractor sp. An92]|uniref:YodL domain-containing protein n=1 Tax=Flavonifractor sp. An92 TaxID=1965666 RepID=UPI0031B81128